MFSSINNKQIQIEIFTSMYVRIPRQDYKTKSIRSLHTEYYIEILRDQECLPHIRLYKGNFRVVCPRSFKLDRKKSLKDIIGFMKSFFVNRLIDFLALHEKCFAIGDATGLAKVSRVHCHSGPGLSILESLSGTYAP